MEASAGLSTVGTGKLEEAAKRRKPNDDSATTNGGSVATMGEIKCGQDAEWLRRAQHSSSAGFWMVSRSSVTDITGKRITMSIASAAICVRRLEPLHGA